MKSVIFGAGGQDGRILAAQIESSGQQVLRVNRLDPSSPLSGGDLSSFLAKEQPDEIYYLAAHHRSSEEKPSSISSEWIQSFRVHLEGWVHVLEVVRYHLPRARVLYASSAHVFGDPSVVPQNENTPMSPTCAYGCSKLAGMEAGRYYRQDHQIYVSHLILYPHESIFRSPTFLSKKLLLAAQSAAIDPGFSIQIGDPEAICDWGYAPEYTESMRNVLKLNEPDDFIVATGHQARVRDFAKAVFNCFGLDWERHVVSKPDLLTKPKRRYVGDASKLLKKTGYRPSLCLPELAERLVRDIRKIS